MLGLIKGYDGNDLLLSQRFVKLFTNFNDFNATGNYDVDLYRSKFRIKFGTNAKEQQLILNKAMPDAKNNIRDLFKTIESEIGKNRYNNQSGGLNNSISKIIKKRKEQDYATLTYKTQTKQKMPNQIQYSCYKIMSMGFCHAVYMGVSYLTVLRIPGISKNGMKLKKEPTKNYTLYQKNGRIFSLAQDSNKKNNDCLISSNNNKKLNGNTSKNTRGINKPKSWKNKVTGFFTSKPKSNNNGIEMQNTQSTQNKQSTQNTQSTQSTQSAPQTYKQELTGVFSKCSIL